MLKARLEKSTLKARLETVAHLAIVMLCLVVCGVLVKQHFLAGGSVEPVVTIAPGEQPVLPTEVRGDGTSSALLIALQPDCGYCTRSLPFYRALVRQRDATGRALRIVALVGRPEDVAAESEVLATAEVAVDGVAAVDFGDLGIPGTPFLVALDEHGRVRNTWPGALQPTEQSTVLRELGLAAPNPI